MSLHALQADLIEMVDAAWAQWLAPAAVPLVVLAVAVRIFEVAGRRRWPGSVALAWSLVAAVTVWPVLPSVGWLSIPQVVRGGAGTGAGGTILALGSRWIECRWFGRLVVGVGVLLLVGVVWRARRTRRAWLACGLASGGEERERAAHSVRAAAQALGVRLLPVRVQSGEDARGPALVGWFRPEIVVPRWAVEDSAILDNVVLHECAHFARRDPLAECLLTILCAVFWWHPAAWFVAARHRVVRELACDRLVVQATGDRVAYRDTLIECARRQVAAIETRMAIANRPVVERLIALRRDGGPPRSAWLQLSIAAGVVATGVIVRMQWRVLAVNATPSAVAADSPPAENLPSETSTAIPDGPGCLARRYAVLAALHRAESQSK